MSGDTAKCESIARNLCEARGISIEEGINQARQFFHI